MKILKKTFIIIMIIFFTAFYTLSLVNTKSAYAFVVPSISGVVQAASAIGDAGSAMESAGQALESITPLATPAGPFGLATAANQTWKSMMSKAKALTGIGKAMTGIAKLQVALSKVQSAVNAATNAVADVYNAEGDITDARNSLLSQGITLNNCSGGQGIMGSVAAEQCTDDSINNNIAELQGTYSDLGGQAGISGAGVSGVLSGSSPNQTSLINGVNNFSSISENGLGGDVSISPTSNLCYDEIAAGIVTSPAKCYESYTEAVNSELNKNMLVAGTNGIADGNAEIAEGSGFSSSVSNVSGSYDLQQVELLKMLAEENAQQLKATGALTDQIALANQAKAAKAINNKKVPIVGKSHDPIKEMISNGWYY